MKRLSWLVAGFVLLAALGFGIRGETKLSEPARWEFMTQHRHPTQLPSYNALGHAGWELVDTFCDNNLNQCVYF